MGIKKIITNKYIIAGVASVFILGGLLYSEYRKIMNYCISFSKVHFNKATLDNIDIDIFMNFKNQSNIQIDIVGMTSNVFLNDAFVTTVSNKVTQVIKAESTSVIGFNIQFNPTAVYKVLKLNITDLLAHRENIIIKIDMKMKVKLWLIEVNIPYTYQNNLKDMMAVTAPADSSATKQGKCK